MDIKIKPDLLNGEVNVPASKSIMHRALICASLSNGSCTISNTYLSEDIKATIKCLENLGASFEIFEDKIKVNGIKQTPKNAVLDCNESGSTIRFLIPIAMALGVDSEFIGKGKLVTRPLNTYVEAFQNKGVEFNYNGCLPALSSGKLKSGNYTIKGNVSSQFITGLLFALPLLDGDSTITVLPPFESKSYVDITLSCLKSFGIEIKQDDLTFYIKGNQSYKATDYYVESDYSQVAFFLVGNVLGNNIKVKNFYRNSVQGDSAIIDILEKIGVECIFDNGLLQTNIKSKNSFNIDASDIPDLVPILCVLASFCDGVSTISNVYRLKIKESDRILSTMDIIKNLGGKISYDENNDKITIYGGLSKFNPCTLKTYNDHRIAMCSAIASTICTDDVTVLGAECVNKSYPTFFEVFKNLGGAYDVINVE